MFNNTKWFVVLGVTVLAFGLLFGTAMADPGNDDGEGAWHMHEQMSPDLYAQMIQRMTEVHGAEFTAEMVQRMNEGGDCLLRVPVLNAIAFQDRAELWDLI